MKEMATQESSQNKMAPTDVQAEGQGPLRIFLDSANQFCRPNGVLTSRIYKYLQKNGHSLVKDPGEADYVICNTCGFDENFRNVSLSLFKDYGKAAPREARVLSVGCLNAMYKDFESTVPNLDLIPNISDLDKVFYRRVRFDDITEAYFQSADANELFKNHKGLGISEQFVWKIGLALQGMLQNRIDQGIPEAVMYKQMMEEFDHKHKVFVEISGGCTFNCSYCVIPAAKGHTVVSRSFEHILGDIEKAREPGKVVCLVSDDCGSYGIDIGATFIDLLRAIGERFPDQPLDVLYLHPVWLQRHREAYEDILTKSNLRVINIPVQTGSQRLLPSMNRYYDINGTLESIRRMKKKKPMTLFLTHIIVGFPGETEEDFKKTLNVVENYDMFWHFRYTDHDGAKACALAEKVPHWKTSLRSMRMSVKRLTQHLKLVASAMFNPSDPMRATTQTNTTSQSGASAS